MKIALLSLALTAPVFASPVYWTDWVSIDADQNIHGVITLADTSTVNVTYTGGFYFANLSPATNYWSPDTYSGGDTGNAPSSLNTDIIAFGTGAGGKFTFSSVIVNPILAVVSMNGPTLQFDAPFTVQNSGCGFWGCDTLIAGRGNVLSSAHGGEGHGSIEFSGALASLSFTESGSENWRGLTLGIQAVATPEPAPWELVLSALAVAWGFRQRVRNPAE